jgi:hypothetical protein
LGWAWLCPVVGAAEEEWQIGPVKPRPHLDVALTYDDNVLISPANEQDDFSVTVSPGLQLVYGETGRNYVSLDYTAGLERFLRLTNQDADNHYVTFDSHLELNRLALGLNHAFRDITGPNIEVGTRVEERQNVSHLDAEYRLSEKTAVGLNYRQEFHEYTSTNLTDFSQLEVGGAFYYQVLPKTDLFGQFNYGWVEEDGGADASYQEANLGVRGQLTRKVTGTVKGGYQHRQFAGPIDSVDAFAAAVSLLAEFSERTAAELVLSRNINPSVTSPGNSYEATRVGLILRQKLWKEKITLALSGVYEHDDYDQLVFGTKRRDDFWDAGVEVSYEFTKWFQVGASYHHRENDSTLATVDFDQNLVRIHALIHY